MSQVFVIDTAKTFPTLKNAPIVEASIRWDIESAKELDRQTLRAEIQRILSECEIREQFDKPISAINRFKETFPESTSPWCGFVIKDSKRRLNIDWRPNSLLVSQSAPYQGWDVFSQIAKTIWTQFSEIHAPAAITGLGIRYLSSIPIGRDKGVSDYTQPPNNPFESLGLDRVSFFAQDKLLISGGEYEVQSSRLLLDVRDPPLLMVDIDVKRKKNTPASAVDTTLAEMRFIKNVIFFTILPDAETQFQ